MDIRKKALQKRKEAEEKKKRSVFGLRQVALASFALLVAAVAGSFFIGREKPVPPATRTFSILYPEDYAPEMLASMESRIQEPIRAFANYSRTEEYLRLYIVAQFLNGKELMASVFMKPANYIARDEEGRIVRTLNVIEIYNTYVSPKHRGKKLSMLLVKQALEHVLERKKMDKWNTLLALHISPYDKKMEVAYTLYRTAGFMKAALTKKGPYEYIFQGEKIRDLESPEMVLAKYGQGEKQSDGRYMNMFAEVPVFLQILENSPYTKSDRQKHYETARKIRVVLEAYEEAKSK
jgi:GNAT superfamily N-acetyltransferase